MPNLAKKLTIMSDTIVETVDAFAKHKKMLESILEEFEAFMSALNLSPMEDDTAESIRLELMTLVQSLW